MLILLSSRERFHRCQRRHLFGSSAGARLPWLGSSVPGFLELEPFPSSSLAVAALGHCSGLIRGHPASSASSCARCFQGCLYDDSLLAASDCFVPYLLDWRRLALVLSFLPGHSYFCSGCRPSLVLALPALPSSLLESNRIACPSNVAKHSMSLVLLWCLFCLRCRVYQTCPASHLLLLDRHCHNNFSASQGAGALELYWSNAVCLLFLLVLRGWWSSYSSMTLPLPAGCLLALSDGPLPQSMPSIPLIIMLSYPLPVVDSSPNSELLLPIDSYYFSRGSSLTSLLHHLNYKAFAFPSAAASWEIGCSENSFFFITSLLSNPCSISMSSQPFLVPFRFFGTCLEYLPVESLWNCCLPLESRRVHPRSTMETWGSSFADPGSLLPAFATASNCRWCGHSSADGACFVVVGRWLSCWVLELQQGRLPFSPGSGRGHISVGSGPCPGVWIWWCLMNHPLRATRSRLCRWYSNTDSTPSFFGSEERNWFVLCQPGALVFVSPCRSLHWIGGLWAISARPACWRSLLIPS